MKNFIYLTIFAFILLQTNIVFAGDAEEAKMLRILEQTYDEDLIMKGFQDVIQEAAEKQVSALTGTFTYGHLLNDTSNLNARKWSPEDWASALSGGNEQRYNELLKSYQDAHPTLSTSEASSGMSSAYSTDYQQQVATNNAASTNATYAFNETNEHLDNIKEISDEIDKTEDSKVIQDLNARLNTEVAYLQVEIIKGLSVVNQQLAQQQASEIVDKTAAAKFNQIPE